MRRHPALIRVLRSAASGAEHRPHVRETLGICERAYILMTGGPRVRTARGDLYNYSVRSVYLGEISPCSVCSRTHRRSEHSTIPLP